MATVHGATRLRLIKSSASMAGRGADLAEMDLERGLLSML